VLLLEPPLVLQLHLMLLKIPPLLLILDEFVLGHGLLILPLLDLVLGLLLRLLVDIDLCLGGVPLIFQFDPNLGLEMVHLLLDLSLHLLVDQVCNTSSHVGGNAAELGAVLLQELILKWVRL
jgi:hypothetical protein